MSDIKLAGVMRAGTYSPNHVCNDAAIFNAVADELRRRGYEVAIYGEEQFQNSDISERVIFNMCRDPKSVEKLQQLEEEGHLVINSGYGIENCTRERMTQLLIDNHIPYPDSLTIDTDAEVADPLRELGINACWIKRGDFHAIHKEDVSYCRHPEEAREMLREYSYRGIRRAVINRHLPGDLIKFYGVSGRPFFHWFYPFDAGHSKYGLEAVNGKSKGLLFSVESLKEICRKASEVLGLKVYGGDCIVDSDGSIRVIDFNDWPSFAPCRAEAAVNIADCIMDAIRGRSRGAELKS